MIWRWMYSHNVLFNDMLEIVTLGPQRWLNDAETALNGVSVMRIWKALGSNMVLLLAGLQTIPRDLYEAASIDGANRWHQFRYVTLPGQIGRASCRERGKGTGGAVGGVKNEV